MPCGCNSRRGNHGHGNKCCKPDKCGCLSPYPYAYEEILAIRRSPNRCCPIKPCHTKCRCPAKPKRCHIKPGKCHLFDCFKLDCCCEPRKNNCDCGKWC